MFGAEVSNGIVTEIRRAKDHIVRPDSQTHKNEMNKL